MEAVLNACYAFIDRAYIYLDMSPKGDIIKVRIKPKNKMSAKQVKALHGDFMNELLYSSLRYQISKNNKKIREYVVGRAFYYPVAAPAPETDTNDNMNYLEDPLGIAIPWEEKYGKKKKNKIKAR